MIITKEKPIGNSNYVNTTYHKSSSKKRGSSGGTKAAREGD